MKRTMLRSPTGPSIASLIALSVVVGCATGETDSAGDAGAGAATSSGGSGAGGTTAGGTSAGVSGGSSAGSGAAPSSSGGVGAAPSTGGVGTGGGSSGGAGGSSGGAGGAGGGSSGGTGASGGTAGVGSGGTARGGATSGGSSSGGSAGGGSAGAGSGGTASAGGGGLPGSAGTGPVTTGLPYAEDFEDGLANGFTPWNDKSTPVAWTVVTSGTSKVYQPQAAVSELEWAVGGSSRWTDQKLSVKVRLGDEESAVQIATRFSPPKNYYFIEMGVGKFKLRARTDSSTKDLIAPSPKPVITANTWYTVTLTVKGSLASISLNGAAVGTATAGPAELASGGIAIGVAEGSASFDDLSVTLP